MYRAVWIAVLILLTATVFSPTVEAQEPTPTCEMTSATAVMIAGISTVDFEGKVLDGGSAVLEGRGVVLGGGVGLLNGSQIFSGDLVESGLLRNAGDSALRLTFTDGRRVLLPPGGAFAVAEPCAKCQCACECVTDDGANSRWATFPCDNNQDTCQYNGDTCRFKIDGSYVYGTFRNCRKEWVL